MGSVKGTTKSGGQKHELDKFYTKPAVALECIQALDLNSYAEIIEPSAGSGAFSNQIPGCTAYDLDPEDASITKADWFTIDRTRVEGKKILVIGNPPFGQQNNLAVAFINHAAKFADTVAFILPKSFMKDSVQKLLNPHLFLRSSVILQKNSFELEGQDMDVPCVFQIWDYNPNATRAAVIVPRAAGFKFVKKDANPNLYIQRVGGNAGKAGVDWENRSEQSNYFVQLDTPADANKFVEQVNNTSFPSRDFSVGPRSLSKNEFLSVFIQAHPEYKG